MYWYFCIVLYTRQLKTSRVKPVHKRDELSSFCNYIGLPNSLLQSMSKVFEYVIFNQLKSFLTENQLFCMEQFGSSLAIQPNWLLYG